jgi:hypothetical protein
MANDAAELATALDRMAATLDQPATSRRR